MTDPTYRNRHHRLEHHFGDLPATLVELSSALGFRLSAGATLEAALTEVNDLIFRLENDLPARHVVAYAIIKGSVADSLTADALLLVPVSASVSADAVVQSSRPGSLSADAYLTAGDGGSGSVTADAIFAGSFTGSATADAIFARALSGSFTADAVVVVVWTTPADQTTMSSTPTLEFNLPDSPGGDMHFQIEIDTDIGFGSPAVWTSHLDQTGWEYWDGDSWEAIPQSGVPVAYAGEKARYTVQTPLGSGTYYRRVRVGVI